MVPSLPGASLRPQEALGAFGSLGASDSGTFVPHHPLTPLAPSPLGLPEASRSPGNLQQSWEPLAALGPQSDSGALLPHSPHLLDLPSPPGAFLGPQESLETFRSLGSLQQPWDLSQTEGPCSPCPCSLPPLAPRASPEPQETLGTFSSLGPQSDSGTLLPLALAPPCPLAPLAPLLPLVPSHPLGLPAPPPPGPFWGLRKPLVALEPQFDSEAREANEPPG